MPEFIALQADADLLSESLAVFPNSSTALTAVDDLEFLLSEADLKSNLTISLENAQSPYGVITKYSAKVVGRFTDPDGNIILILADGLFCNLTETINVIRATLKEYFNN